MTTTELLAMFDEFRTITFPAAAVVVEVKDKADPNTTWTANGLRGNRTVARVIGRTGGLSNNTDMGVFVDMSAFPDASKLPGCEATITDASGAITTGRLLPVRVHALGGIGHLMIGESDRVV